MIRIFFDKNLIAFYVSLLSDVIGTEYSDEFKKIILELVERPVDVTQDNSLHQKIVYHVLTQSSWFDQKEIVEALLNKEDQMIDLAIIEYVMTEPYAIRYDWLDRLLKRPYKHLMLDALVKNVFPLKFWDHKREEIHQKIREFGVDSLKLKALYEKRRLEGRENFIEDLVKNGSFKDENMLLKSFSREGELMDLGFKKPELIDYIIEKSLSDAEAVVGLIFASIQWRDAHPERVRNWIDQFVKASKAPKQILLYILTQDVWSHETEWFKRTVLQLKEEVFLDHEIMQLERVKTSASIKKLSESPEFQSFIKEQKIKWPIDYSRAGRRQPIIESDPLLQCQHVL